MKQDKKKEKIVNKILIGLLSGTLTGFFIGMILLFLDAFPKIVEKFGASSIYVAFSAHMISNIFMGILISLIFFEKCKNYKTSILYSTFVSLSFWIFATIIVKPLKFGGTFQSAFLEVFTDLNILVGHIIFGVILGIFLYLIKINKNYFSKKSFKFF